MADALTPNYSWTLPTVGADTGAWGGLLNNDLLAIDAQVWNNSNGPNITVSSTPGTSVKATVTFQNASAPTGQKTRWVWAEDTVTESGGNVGSNLSLQAYSDTGALISTPIGITRSTGAVAFSVAPTFTSGITGVTDGSNAPAGKVGEILSASASAIPAGGSAIAVNVCSLTLTPGDWDLWGTVIATIGSGGASFIAAGISGTSATLDPSWRNQIAAAFQATSQSYLPISFGGVKIGVSTTYYVVAEIYYPSGTCELNATVEARRRR